MATIKTTSGKKVSVKTTQKPVDKEKPPPMDAAVRMANMRARRKSLLRVAKKHEGKKSLPELLKSLEQQLIGPHENLEGASWCWAELGRRFGWKMP